MKAQQPDHTNDDEDNTINTKESKPIKGNVQFSKGTHEGFDNESFEGDKEDGVVKARNQRNNKKNEDKRGVITVGYAGNFRKVLFTVICLNYLFYGFANNLIGATLPQLKENLGVNNEKILRAFSVRYSSYFIFNLLSEYICRMIFRFKQYQYALGIFLYSSAFFVLPVIQNYPVFLALFAVLGAGNVLLDSIPILLTVEMFEEKSKFYSQVQFVWYAFGGFLGPLVAGQFVSLPDTSQPPETDVATARMNHSYPHDDSSFNPAGQYYVVYNIFETFFHHNKTFPHHISHPMNVMQNDSDVPILDQEESSLYIPFYMIASLFTIVMVFQTLLQFFYPYQRPRVIDKRRKASMRYVMNSIRLQSITTEADVEHVEKEEAKLPSYYKKAVIFLFCIVLLCFNSIDQTLSLFLSTYLNNRHDLAISVSLQSSFYSYLAITNTIGKLFGLVLIWYIPQKVYLFMNWSFILTGILLMNFVTVDSIYVLKISLMLIGAGISSTYPLIFTLANKRVLITSKTQTIFLVAIVSQMLYLPIVFGSLIETYTQIFNVFLNLFASVAFVTIIIFHLVDLKRTSLLRKTNSKPDV